MRENNVPLRPTSESIRELVRELENAAQLASRGKATKRVCDLFDSTKKVVSWKFQEWDYGKNNIQLPCNARGLFILDDPENPEIVARGYDKFFNIGEVVSTKWEAIEAHTVGPYDVTLKSNGCIILISALSDGTIVVCSKHSTGPRTDVDRSHAESGREYLLKQLKEADVDPEAFARELYELNITAVAEYCDDSFEEHILEYKGDKAGLYLHGINLNQRTFATWPMDRVSQFASKYGFKPTAHFAIEDVSSLKNFLDECSERGSYDALEVEGFVIRCHCREDGQDFFFKYKFEEPYLMYRQWREVTKDYITTKCRIFKFRKHKFITNQYLDFVIPILDNNPELCERYMRGFDIISLRNMFLQHYGMTAMEILNYEKVKELELRNAVDFDKVDENTKFLIFPIAVIGCGKTTTALTLKNLYPDSWAVVQNDDITSRDKSMLMKKSLELLATPNIKCVIVDRNNHQYRERQQLFTWLADLKEEYLPYDTNIKVIGLSFIAYENLQSVRELTLKRVLARGDNHQSIKSSVYGEKKVVGIMQGFLNRFQPVVESKSPDNKFDLIIPLRVSHTNSSLENARKTLLNLNSSYPQLVPSMPSEEEIEKAFAKSLTYKPTIIKHVKGKGSTNPKERQATFYSAHIRERQAMIDEIQKALKSAYLSERGKECMEKLFKQDKFQPEFHITLSHVSQAKKGTEDQRCTWKNFASRYQKMISTNEEKDESMAPITTADTVKFKLNKLCWDEKIVSVIADLPEHPIIDCNGQIVPQLKAGNAVSHITIGILQPGVAPFYSNKLCQRVLKGSDKNTWSIDFDCCAQFEAEVRINF
ncbi:hypothetical protein HG536_0F01620 [Torulaspora globosa]|uniref:tRNA ligase n=1 Tax=Torulaspora globosa TaxID=48254 RepID=A0A7G3ZK01_9SACH|nr:uncharacterized protein HG536_0F01620 [Torulaspora globosa]QLL33837.1 hypothetical protein HG536_0F01620 [Torulaspora globosa]